MVYSWKINKSQTSWSIESWYESSSAITWGYVLTLKINLNIHFSLKNKIKCKVFLAAVYTFKWVKSHVINLSIEKILLRYPPVFLSPDERLRRVRYRPGCFPGRISYWSSESSASLGEVRFCCVPAALFWRKASYLSHKTGKQRQQSMQTKFSKHSHLNVMLQLKELFTFFYFSSHFSNRLSSPIKKENKLSTIKKGYQRKQVFKSYDIRFK